MRREICEITRESFAAYGTVLEFSGPRGWEIAVREESPGWRIALLEFGAGPARRLECHPFSRESFEPVQGTGIPVSYTHLDVYKRQRRGREAP